MKGARIRDKIGGGGTNASGDDWLTPPELLESLGKFNMDPCCPPRMPWRTAKHMLVKGKVDGLVAPWKGRVWLNPPYSNVLPWIQRMVQHNYGMMLVYARSTDTRWGQTALGNCHSAFFFAGRLLFHYPNGELSNGKWNSSMLLAFGERDGLKLLNWAGSGLYPGTLMQRIET